MWGRMPSCSGLPTRSCFAPRFIIEMFTIEIGMSSTLTAPTRPRTRSTTVPWYIWCSVAGRHLRNGRRALGHLLAPLHRPRQFLDARARRDLHVRGAGRPLLRLADPRRLHSASDELKDASVKMWGFAGRWGHSSAPGAAWPCSPPRLSTIGGTTPTAWTSKSSARRTWC